MPRHPIQSSVHGVILSREKDLRSSRKVNFTTDPYRSQNAHTDTQPLVWTALANLIARPSMLMPVQMGMGVHFA
jgi:hypothetical protein